MPALVLVGAQWGDEGKGKIAHYLSARAHLVARYQGGNNAGHTVVFGGRTFALHTIPSGILVPRVRCALGNGVVINARALREEVRSLERAGVRVRGRLFISPLCHMVLPYHVLLDSIREEAGGIGTTKKGIGPCYEDKVARLGVRLCDFLDERLFAELAERSLALKSAELAKARRLRSARAQTFAGARALRAFLRPFAADISALIDEALSRGRRVLFEVAQGAMLDVDFGTYPFVTSSSPAAGGACVGAGVGPTRIGSVIAVSKAYTTRVGRGPFPTEMEPAAARRLREAGREYGATTGRPRRIGWLDLVQLRYALRINGAERLAFTKLDTLSGVDPLLVCTAYRVRQRVLREFPCSRRDAQGAEPLYERLPGFAGDISKARRMGELPPNARRYLAFAERRLGAGIAIVSVGPGREQTIARGPLGWTS